MSGLKDLLQSADWKREKHVPSITAPSTAGKGKNVAIAVSVGKEIPHPNKTEHHIRWIEVYFLPDGEKFPFQIGQAIFTAHGESVAGPDTSGVYSHPEVTLTFRTEKPGSILALAYCNIHGLWENAQRIAVE